MAIHILWMFGHSVEGVKNGREKECTHGSLKNHINTFSPHTSCCLLLALPGRPLAASALSCTRRLASPSSGESQVAMAVICLGTARACTFSFVPSRGLQGSSEPQVTSCRRMLLVQLSSSRTANQTSKC